ILELSTNINYGSRWASTGIVGDTEYGDMGNQGAKQVRFSASYVTGTHAFKAGFYDMWGSGGIRNVSPLYDVEYIFRNQLPVQLVEGAYPFHEEHTLKADLGLFAQDQWTLKKLTLNLGLRFDYLNAYDAAQCRPASRFTAAVCFPETPNVPNWKD